MSTRSPAFMPIHEAVYARNSSFSESLHSSKFFEATNTTPRVWVAALVIVAVLWRAPNLPSTSSRSEMFWFMQAWMEMLVVGAILALALPQDFRRDLGFGDFESPTPRGWVAAFVILIFVAFALPPAGSDSAVVEKKRVDQRHQYKTTKNRDTAFEAPADAKEPQDSPRATSTVVATGSSIVRGIINRSKALTYSPPYSSPSLRSPHSPLSTSSRVRQEYEWCVDRISESKRNPKTWKTWAMDFYDEQQRKKNKVAQQKDGNHDDHDDDSDSDEGNDNHAQTPALHRAVSLAPQKIVEYRVRGADGTSKIVSANDEPETSRTTEKLPAWADRSSMTDDEWEYYGASPPSERRGLLKSEAEDQVKIAAAKESAVGKKVSDPFVTSPKQAPSQPANPMRAPNAWERPSVRKKSSTQKPSAGNEEPVSLTKSQGPTKKQTDATAVES